MVFRLKEACNFPMFGYWFVCSSFAPSVLTVYTQHLYPYPYEVAYLSFPHSPPSAQSLVSSIVPTSLFPSPPSLPLSFLSVLRLSSFSFCIHSSISQLKLCISRHFNFLLLPLDMLSNYKYNHSLIAQLDKKKLNLKVKPQRTSFTLSQSSLTQNLHLFEKSKTLN